MTLEINKKEQDMNEQKQMMVIDHDTGEVAPYEEPQEIVIGSDAVVKMMQEGRLPLHVQKLQELQGLTAAEKEQLYSLYETPAVSFDSILNTVVEVHGVIIHEHLPYKGKDGLYHAGYFNPLFLIVVNGDYQIVRSSSAGNTMHAMNMIALRETEGQQGWYLWDEPVKYRAAKGPDGSHRFVNADKVKLPKRAVKVS